VDFNPCGPKNTAIEAGGALTSLLAPLHLAATI
jgi:hypothetical protein